MPTIHRLFKRVVSLGERFLKRGREIKGSTIFLPPGDWGGHPKVFNDYFGDSV